MDRQNDGRQEGLIQETEAQATERYKSEQKRLDDLVNSRQLGRNKMVNIDHLLALKKQNSTNYDEGNMEKISICKDFQK